ncbi:polysaccharide biosynthesis tyrosine autokinase [Myxosarcina sp. GI1]|uniref:GumC family protein n=1 Tax=Myxosarcina sp. GI1 TaxID=1541065 RepID=UPI00055E0B4A|nr:polysaccharide biosynthesis tyrosine autokinase [Myxosarcina sp. GI1]
MTDTGSDRPVYSAILNGRGDSNEVKNGNHSYAHVLPVANTTSIDEDEDSIDLRQLATVFKHRLRLILAIALGSTIVSAILTFIQEPIYKGSFQLLVEPVTQDEQSSPLEILSQESSGLDYETQIEVLRSPKVLTPIIAELNAKYPELEYKDLIIPKDSPLEIEQLDRTKILEVSYIDEDPQKIQFVLSRLAESYLAYSIDERKVQVKQGIDFVDQQLPRVRARVDELQAELQRFRQKYNLLDPQGRAVFLAEKQSSFEDKYFETQGELNETTSLYNLLQKQLGLQPQEALAASYLSESPRYQNLLDRLQEVEVELAQESARFLPDNPNIQVLQDKRNELLPLLQKEAGAIFGDNLSDLIDNKSNISSPSTLRLDLSKQYIEAANQIQILTIREQSLKSALSKLERQTELMPVIARQYTDLERELMVATESLNRFLAAQEELQLEGAKQGSPWQTIAPPILAENPVSPNPPRNLLLGLFGGVLLGLGTALLAERLDPVFHSTEELKESVQLPILGEIPVQTDLKPLDELETAKTQKFSFPQLQIGNKSLNINTSASSDRAETPSSWQGSSPFIEAFRSLNTNIRLLGSDTSIRSIVISSSIPSEGKSTISSHLAQAAAAMGQKVLLIDADLRRPQVHRWIGVENKAGLSNILATGLNIEEAIIKVPQWENLSVITAGDIPPDPTRLLSSQKMQQLMDKLKSEPDYDLIIYDTPPILGFADGRILASRTNGVVLVVRIGTTDRALLKQNIDNIRVYNVPVLGIVANQVNRSSRGYHYYNHYYTDRK